MAADPGFAAAARELFPDEPTGRLVLPTLQQALERIAELEQRVQQLICSDAASPHKET